MILIKSIIKKFKLKFWDITRLKILFKYSQFMKIMSYINTELEL
jgi:hypothetical protein